MPNTESYPFASLAVDHVILGGSRIWWTILPEFADPGPHIFQLQVSLTGTHNARDWQNVGIPATDAVYLVDDDRRLSDPWIIRTEASPARARRGVRRSRAGGVACYNHRSAGAPRAGRSPRRHAVVPRK